MTGTGRGFVLWVVPPGPCQIIKRLPAANGEFQYVVRSEYEDHQRVAKENELSRY